MPVGFPLPGHCGFWHSDARRAGAGRQFGASLKELVEKASIFVLVRAAK
jgi:hypothetical protein